MTTAFVECATCAAKPGSPTLCESCLANRTAISNFEARAGKKLVIEPRGWPCRLYEARGLFMFGDTLCVRSDHGEADSYIASNGEAFWGGAKGKEERARLMVQPVTVVVET